MNGSEALQPRSALVTLILPSSVLSSDPLVALVAAIAPPFQTSVVISKKKNDTFSLTLGTASASGTDTGPDTLTHRNAILRSLCGMGLHNALDDLGSSPLLFLGGHSAASYTAASPVSAMAIAGISSWMSVASSIREEGSAENVSKLIGQLNVYLSTRSFLVPSAAPTLADLDLYLSIVSNFSGDDLESMVGSSVNARRWLEQVGATLEDLTVEAAKRAEYSKLPPVNIPKGLNPAPRLLPLFFYGDEDESVVAAIGSAASAQTVGKNGKISGDKPVGAQKEEITNKQTKEAKQKRANKAAEKAAKTPKTKPAAELNVSALDIRVGKIVKAWEHESSDKLYCEEVDLGEENGPRKIASGLRAFYKLEEMQNRMVLVLCNLKARNLGGFPSHGMVLCASNADHTAVEFAVPPEVAKIGERIVFEGFEGDPEPENKVAKKKIFDKLSPDLKTDSNGIVVWKGVKGVTSAGVCKAVSGMANAQVS